MPKKTWTDPLEQLLITRAEKASGYAWLHQKSSMVFKKKNGISRSISLSLAIWSLLFMFHSATRLVAPSIIFSFAMANMDLNRKNKLSD